MEYNKSYEGKELLPDRFTTNSEGLFLGYEEIPEDSLISEAIEVFENNIKQLLNKLSVKVEQLSEEFQNWKEKISTLKSSKEVSQFFNKMAQAAEKVYVNQNNNQPVSNKDKFPYWVFISISLLLVTVLVGIIIYRRKKRK